MNKSSEYILNSLELFVDISRIVFCIIQKFLRMMPALRWYLFLSSWFYDHYSYESSIILGRQEASEDPLLSGTLQGHMKHSVNCNYGRESITT